MDKPLVQPLSRVRRGKKAKVVALTGGQEFQRRLVSMGLNVGCEIEIVRNGGSGGPTLLAMGETRLAIGHGMISRIMVTIDP